MVSKIEDTLMLGADFDEEPDQLIKSESQFGRDFNEKLDFNKTNST